MVHLNLALVNLTTRDHFTNNSVLTCVAVANMKIKTGIEVIRLAIDLSDFGEAVSEYAGADKLDLDVLVFDAWEVKVFEYHKASAVKLKEVIARHFPKIRITMVLDLLSQIQIITLLYCRSCQIPEVHHLEVFFEFWHLLDGIFDLVSILTNFHLNLPMLLVVAVNFRRLILFRFPIV